jgi:Penicillin-Binding Protein C-terminus Family
VHARLAVLSIGLIFIPVVARSQPGQMMGLDIPAKQEMPAASDLKPAEGASVKIVSPKKGEVIKGDQVPLRFKLVKGRQGSHVHAYVDGELMGMFQSEKGTLTGVKPGTHTLELRVVAKDHVTELKATDRAQFVVK